MSESYNLDNSGDMMVWYVHVIEMTQHILILAFTFIPIKGCFPVLADI